MLIDPFLTPHLMDMCTEDIGHSPKQGHLSYHKASRGRDDLATATARLVIVLDSMTRGHTLALDLFEFWCQW